MIGFHKSLFQFVKDNAEIESVVGDRIYHEWAPQNVKAWPLLVFTNTSGQEFAGDMDAPNDAKIDQLNYQFDLYARSSLEAVEGSEIVNSVLRNLRGTIGTVAIQHVELSNVQHLGEQVGDKQVRRVSLDYAFWFNTVEA